MISKMEYDVKEKDTVTKYLLKVQKVAVELLDFLVGLGQGGFPERGCTGGGVGELEHLDVVLVYLL